MHRDTGDTHTHITETMRGLKYQTLSRKPNRNDAESQCKQNMARVTHNSTRQKLKEEPQTMCGISHMACTTTETLGFVSA